MNEQNLTHANQPVPTQSLKLVIVSSIVGAVLVCGLEVFHLVEDFTRTVQESLATPPSPLSQVLSSRGLQSISSFDLFARGGIDD